MTGKGGGFLFEIFYAWKNNINNPKLGDINNEQQNNQN